MTDGRRGRPRDARIDAAIVDAAVDELADAGFAAFCVEGVAERAGVSKATVYRRFATRDQLIEGALVAVAADAALLPRGQTARARLVAMLEDIRQRTPDSRVFRIMRHSAALLGTSTATAELAESCLIEPRRERLRAGVREGISTGEFRPDLDVDAVVTLLVGAVVHLGIWSGSESVDRTEVSDLVDLAVTGMAPR